MNISKNLYISFSLIITAVLALVAESNGQISTFSENGAWCWFQDPRAVYIEGQHKRTYAGWVTNDGKLHVGSFDHEMTETEIVTIKDDWGADDHNTCSFLVLPDKRITIFYAQHNKTGLYCRTTTSPEDILNWEEEITVTDRPRVTYSHPIYLENEKRFYVFWRGESWKPTFAVSADGLSWSKPGILIQDKNRAAQDIRPYIKIISDGKATIHFSFTDGHPRNESLNSIYYLKYENGVFYKADGTVAGYFGRLPIEPEKTDLVYDGRKTGVRSWIWDIALDHSGFPVIAYTRFPHQTDHRYHYARWIGNAWLDTEITPAGKWFPQTPDDQQESETYYSAGMALNTSQPGIVYLSRQVDGEFEIEKWTTPDYGQNWTFTAITQNSIQMNVRPVFPRYCPPEAAHVLWMYGAYIHYTDFATGIRLSAKGQ